jgi:phage gpG-like protein
VIIGYLADGEQISERLRKSTGAVSSSLIRCITQLGTQLQGDVQREELSGQVLKNRTGSLKSSIGVRIDQSRGAIAAIVFTDSRYAGVQEYGFVGPVSVKASLRRIRTAFNRAITERTISVRAYDRRLNLPERSFLRSALEDMTPAIRDGVEAALEEALSQ